MSSAWFHPLGADIVGAMRIGAEIRRRRKLLGWPLEELSHRSGLSVNFLSELENDHRDPRLSTLDAIAGALGVEVAELLGSRNGLSAAASDVGKMLDSLSTVDQEVVVRVAKALSVSANPAATKAPKPASRKRRKA